MSTKEAIKQQQTNGPALATYALDPFEAYANAVAPRTIIGTLLRFSKGDYLAGEEGKEIPNGSTFTANLDELLAGWIKWSGGRPIEHMMVRVAEGRTLPKREVLGDSDASHWEAAARACHAIHGSLPTTFRYWTNKVGSSPSQRPHVVGSPLLVILLARLYARHRLAGHRDVHPMIALDVGSYLHPNREYGRIKYPLFTRMGWVSKTAFNEALAAAGFTPGAEPPALQEEAQAEQMNDEIPF